MSDFYAPQIQSPDVLGSYLRGAAAPGQLQMQQQAIQAGGLNLDQLRLAMQAQQMKQQAAQQYMNAGQSQGAGTPGGGTGGVQNGPQASGSPLSDFMSAQQLKLAQGLDVLEGRDPLATAQKAQDMALNIKKMQLQGPMNLAQQVATDPQANIMVSKNPQLLQGFKQWAAARGMNPDDPSVLTLSNAQAAARAYYNNLQGQIGQSGGLGFSGTLKPGEAAYQNGQVVAGSAEATTPYQQQEMQLRQQEHALAQQRFAFEQNQSKIPSGYQVNAKDPTQIEPIPGGPKDPNAATAGGMGGREGVMFQRIANAGNSAAESIKNITELPVGASTGWFGTAEKGTSLLGSVKGVLTQKLNGQDIQDYQTMLAGVSRNLATLETSGLAPGGSLTHSLDALAIGQGDTQMTKLRKLAEMRQIVDTNLSPQLSNPKIPAPQKAMIQGIIDKIDKSVPFTHSDITALQQSKNPHATLMDFAKSSGVQAQADKHPPEIQDLLSKYK